METQTIERAQARHAGGPATLVAYAGAAAFVIAAGWFWLVTKNVTVAAPPLTGPHVLPLQGMRIYYRWQATTLPQERYYTVIAILGFICLAIAVRLTRDVVARGRTVTTTAAVLIGAGAATWIIGSIVELGGHHAIGLMATHTNPIQTTNSIAFTIDMIAAAFALAAFALIGIGMLALAAAAAREHSGHRAWAGYTIVIALALLVLAWSYAAGQQRPLRSAAVRCRRRAVAVVAGLDLPHRPGRVRRPERGLTHASPHSLPARPVRSRGGRSALLSGFSGGLPVGLVIAVCCGVGSDSVLPPTVEDRTGYRAGSSGDHRGTRHLAPAPTPRLARLDPLRGGGQHGRDLRPNAVLHEVPGALKLRRGPSTRRPDAVLGRCAGTVLNWLQACCRPARASQRAFGSVVAVHFQTPALAMRIRLALPASPIARDQPFRNALDPHHGV